MNLFRLVLSLTILLTVSTLCEADPGQRAIRQEARAARLHTLSQGNFGRAAAYGVYEEDFSAPVVVERRFAFGLFSARRYSVAPAPVSGAYRAFYGVRVGPTYGRSYGGYRASPCPNGRCP